MMNMNRKNIRQMIIIKKTMIMMSVINQNNLFKRIKVESMNS